MDRLLRNRTALIAALAALTAAAFAPTVRNGFVPLDDAYYLTSNTMVRLGLSWKGTLWAFSSFEMGNWNPVAWLSLMLDWQLFGPWAGGHHLVGLALHGLIAVAIFLWLDEVTSDRARSAAAALFWAVHPLRVESVAWASERKDLLCALFFICACWAHCRRARKGGSGSWTAVFALLALASKPMAVTLPAILLLLDFWPLQRRERPWQLLKEKLPLLALSAACSLMAVAAQTTAGAVNRRGGPLDPLARVGSNLFDYLRLTFWPRGLAPLYYSLTIAPWKVAVGMAALFAVSRLAWMLRARRPAFAVGWAWFLVSMLPVVGLMQVGMQSVADRYTYLPHVGLSMALVWLVPQPSPRWRPALLGAAGALAAAMLLATFAQTRYWRDGHTLFTRTHELYPDNGVATVILAREQMTANDLTSAERTLRQALRQIPGLPLAELNLGMVLMKQGRMPEADAAFARARAGGDIDREVSLAQAHGEAQAGHADEAIALLRQVEAEDEGIHNPALELGVLLDEKGRHDEGIAYLRRAVARGPDDAATHAALGTALARRGQFAEAAREMEAALKLQPDFPGMAQQLKYAREDAAKSSPAAVSAK